MGEIGEKAGLQVGNPAQIIRILIEFRIEGNHAAIRILKLTIEFGELVLLFPQLRQSLQQLLVLAFYFVEGVSGTALGQFSRNAGGHDPRPPRAL